MTAPNSDSPKHRPDGATPEPETDGLNDVLCEMRDSYVCISRALSIGEFSRAMILATAYGAAEARTQLEAEGRAGSSEYDNMFRANLRSIVGNFGVLTSESDTSLVNRAYDGYRLKTQFGSWLAPLQEAEVTMRHANALLRHANKVPESSRDEYGVRVLEFARTATVPQTETYAKKLAADLAAAEFEASCERERAERRIRMQDVDFGMSEVYAYLPTGDAHAMMNLISKQAKILRDEHRLDLKEHKQRVRAAQARGDELSPEDAAFIEDPRTLEQLRADVFVETILSATPQSILESDTAGAARVKANISIVVPVLSLLNPDAATQVATIDGMQPISMAEVRKYAGDVTVFDRILTDPITGHVLAVDTRDAPLSMRKFLRARDQTCRFPGCSRPAHQSELDHTVPWSSGGKTSVDNLKHVCVRHHTQKHQKPWRSWHAGGGVVVWQDPLGDIVTVNPMPLGPTFDPVDDDPPPF